LCETIFKTETIFKNDVSILVLQMLVSISRSTKEFFSFLTVHTYK